MRTASVEFHRLAEKEFEEAFKFYEHRSPEAAARFKVAVDAAVDRIARLPETLQSYAGPYRWVRVQRFHYILVCRHRSANEIIVVAVAHTSRRPGYWKRRQ
jgi:plasmid stabilization system protein ParE